MKFTVSSTLLSKKLVTVSGVITSNPVVPILDNFLFELADNRLTITASDLQTFVTAEIEVESQGNARVAVPARILLDTLKHMPEQLIACTIDEESYNVSISSQTGQYKLAGENAMDFPQVTSNIQEVASMEIDSSVLKAAIGCTIVAASQDELRPAVNGVYISFKEHEVVFVATDGHRLARYIHKHDAHQQGNFIVPKKTLNLLNGLLPSDTQKIQIAFKDTHIQCILGSTHVVSRLIDERYPDYQNVIPTDNNQTLFVDRLTLLNALKRIVIYANRTTCLVKMYISKEGIKLLSEDFDFSNEARESLAGDYEGDELAIGFNAKLLIEILGRMQMDEIIMSFSTPTKATLLFPKEQGDKEEILFLIMPVVTN